MNFCGLLGPAVLLTGMQHTLQTMEKVNPAATPSQALAKDDCPPSGWAGWVEADLASSFR